MIFVGVISDQLSKEVDKIEEGMLGQVKFVNLPASGDMLALAVF